MTLAASYSMVAGYSTIPDGAKNLTPRPAVHGLQPWESTESIIAGKPFQITATPCAHYPGHECTGHILSTLGFGETYGLPNAIYFSGDTAYVAELAEIRHKYHITVAIFNVGAAFASIEHDLEPLQTTMVEKQAARLFHDIGAAILVPMHFESWKHFTQGKEGLQLEFEVAGISEKIGWLEPVVTQKIIQQA